MTAQTATAGFVSCAVCPAKFETVAESMTHEHMSSDYVPQARRWTVRAGTTGSGMDLFEVYQPTMDEARQSVLETAEDTGAEWLLGLVERGFTVHAATQFHPAPAFANLFVHVTPAPDYEALGWDYGVEVRLDTKDGLVDALYVADDGAGMILVHLNGTLQEHPAEALHPRCECGNPFKLCHPDA